jgi:hypothetical protein
VMTMYPPTWWAQASPQMCTPRFTSPSAVPATSFIVSKDYVYLRLPVTEISWNYTVLILQKTWTTDKIVWLAKKFWRMAQVQLSSLYNQQLWSESTSGNASSKFQRHYGNSGAPEATWTDVCTRRREECKCAEDCS